MAQSAGYNEYRYIRNALPFDPQSEIRILQSEIKLLSFANQILNRDFILGAGRYFQ